MWKTAARCYVNAETLERPTHFKEFWELVLFLQDVWPLKSHTKIDNVFEPQNLVTNVKVLENAAGWWLGHEGVIFTDYCPYEKS